MAATIKKDDYIKSLGITLTQEQIDAIPSEVEIDIEQKEMTFEEAQVKFKKEIGTLTATAVKARFKNKKEDSDIEEIDVDAIKAEARAEAKAEANKAATLNSFITNNKLSDDDANNFNILVEADISGGSSLEEAIEAKGKSFIKNKKLTTKTDFGMTLETDENGKPFDAVGAEIDAYLEK